MEKKKDLKIVKVEISAEDRLKQALNKIKKECLRVMPSEAGFDNSKSIETRFGGPAYAE